MGLKDRGRDKKRTSSSFHFIGRADFLDKFSLEWGKEINEEPKFITNIHGIGGVGKSNLLKELLLRHSENAIVYKFDANFDDLSNPLSIIKKITRSTLKNKESIDFSKTERLITRFEKLVNNAAKSSGEMPSTITKMLMSSSQIAGEFIGGPETGKVTRSVLQPLVETGLFLWKSAKGEKDAQLLDSPVRQITTQLIKEINKYSPHNKFKFVIAIDTYEKVSRNITEWILKDLLGEPDGRVEFDLRLIISGREPLINQNRHWQDEWGDELLEFPVELFSQKETYQFLKENKQIENENTLKNIYKTTKGHPFWLNLWPENSADTTQNFSANDFQKIENRLLEMFQEPKHCSWLKQAAFFRRFNQDLLFELIENETSSAFDWLTGQFSIVEGGENYWKLHDLARKVILTNLFKKSQNSLIESASKILKKLEDKSEIPWDEIEDLSKRPQLSEKYDQEFSEIIYYSTLSSLKVQEKYLSFILRLSNKSIEDASHVLAAACQALDDIEISIPKAISFVGEALEQLAIGTTIEDHKIIKSGILKAGLSDCQKALLFNRFGKYIHEKLGEYQIALDYYKQATDIDPQYQWAYVCWGHCLTKLERYEDAIEKCKQATDIDPQYQWAYVCWGHCLTKLERYDDAIEKHKQATDIDPQYQWAYAHWGHCLTKLERYDDAIEKYKQATDIDPQYDEAYGLWGNCLTKLERYEDAIEKYKQATDIDPQYQWAYGLWGNCLTKLERYEDAIEKYKQATDIDPQYQWAYVRWGNCLTKLERYDDAIEKYKQATDIDPQYQWAYVRWGNCLTKLERYDDAIEKYKQATDIDPQYHSAYVRWGNCLTKLERYDDAIEKCKQATDIDPQYQWAYGLWGNCLTKLERYEDAIEKYKQATDIDPQYHWAYIRWGRCLVRLAMRKEGKEAEELYKQAFDKGKKSIEIRECYYDFSCLYAISEDDKNALHFLDLSLRNDEVSTSFVLNDKDWAGFLDKKKFKAIIEKYNNLSS